MNGSIRLGRLGWKKEEEEKKIVLDYMYVPVVRKTRLNAYFELAPLQQKVVVLRESSKASS